MECHVCNYQNRIDAQYCAMCGTRISRACEVCGFSNPFAHRFCIRCGALLSQTTEAQYATDALQQTRSITPQIVTEPESEFDSVPLQQSGERRVATIILADVRGSTDLLEQVGTETWVAMMNRIFQIVEAEIYRYGGQVDQFRGDGLVAFFGTETAHEDDPERAILAALAMQKAIKPYATFLKQAEGIDLSLRIGVNTGEVIVGNVGDKQRYSEYTAMGGAVALAARMETAAEPGTVLVSDNTFRLVETQFEWQNLGAIRVKGLSRDVYVYRPLASKSTNDAPLAFELATPFIGRDQELEVLTNAVEDLEDGLGGIVLLAGERGMGKSLLIRELQQHLARQEALRSGLTSISQKKEVKSSDQPKLNPPAKQLHGRGRSYDQNRPYAVWQDLLNNWLGVRGDETPEMTRDRLRTRCEDLWGNESSEPCTYLSSLMGLPAATEISHPLVNLDADVLRQRYFQAIRSWIEALVLEGPLIIILSDMHWVDDTSLDLLKYSLPMCDYLDLLWIIVFRPERASPLWRFRFELETEYPHRLVTINLQPLESEESREFIRQLIGRNVLDPEAESLIISKAEGNPYYIQELIRALVTDGTLEHQSATAEESGGVGNWRVTRPVTSLNLPDSLQSLLLARIDRLNAAQQSVLQRAAVIGPVFWFELLETIVDEPNELRTHLTVLQRNQLIVERGRSHDMGTEYKFRSRLIRDAAYESLLRPQRVALHSEIAHHLEERFGKPSTSDETDHESEYFERYYGRIIYHYHNANLYEKELIYILKNAKHAQEVYANSVAANLYNQALDLLDLLTKQTNEQQTLQDLNRQRFDILLARHKVNYLLGEFELLQDDAQKMLEIARSIENQPECMIDAILRQPGVADQISYSEIEQGIPMAEEALELSKHACDEQRQIESLIAIVNQRLALSDPSWQALSERALELARELGNRHYESRILVGMGGIYAFSDEPERGMEYLEAAAALAMSEGLEDRVIQMSLLNLLGLEYERNGDYNRVLTEFQQERLNISREIAHRPMESQALQACGRIRGIYLGDLYAGLHDLEECIQILRNTPPVVYPMFHMVQINIMLAQNREATEILDHIEEIGIPVPDRARASYYLLHSILNNAQSARAMAIGDIVSARQYLTDSVRFAGKTLETVSSSPLVSNQYAMAAHCKSAVAYLGLSQVAEDEAQRQLALKQALLSAEQAYTMYQNFGFTQIVECVSEEVLFRYSQVLNVNGNSEDALKYLRRAYNEMSRKHALIPADSPYRRTYLEHIALHQEIQAAYTSRLGSILTDQPVDTPALSVSDD